MEKHRNTARPKFKLPPTLDLFLTKDWGNDLEWDLPALPKPKRHRGTSHEGKGCAARRKILKRDKWNRKRAEWLRKKIASDFERARLIALADARKKMEHFRVELAVAAFEERYKDAEKSWLEKCRADAAAYVAKLKKA